MHKRDFEIRIPELAGTEHAQRPARLLRYLQRAPESRLPLQAACQHGGWADASDREITLIESQTDDSTWVAVVGVYFNETVGGCNCNDDPVSHPAYARLRVVTRLVDGETTISLTRDE